MRAVSLRVLAAVLLTSLLAGCHKDVHDREEWKGPESYPHRVGDEWHYLVTDNARQVGESVTVRIVDYQRGTGPRAHIGVAAVWQYTHSDGRVDTAFVSGRADTVSEWRAGQGGGAYLAQELVFPLVVGAGRRVQGGLYDTTYVAARGTYETQAGSFSNSFRVLRFGYCCNCGYAWDGWFTPGVGFVWHREKGSIWCEGEEETWELFSYKLR